jgi:glycosyltransferase involved in cell wall biosynthesis
MKDDPLVSIGLPVYNGEKTISRAVESLIDQTYTHIEIIISDNGSSDKTLDIINTLAQQDHRIKVLQGNTNRGSIWNFNHVFEESSGEFFMWASHDDLHEVEFVALCVEALKDDEEAVLCAPRMQMVLEGILKPVWISSMNSFTDKRQLLPRFRETLMHFPAVSIYGMFRKSALKKTRLLRNVMGGDLLLIQELSLFGHFVGLDRVLFTRMGRQRWNTKHQDYMTFFGKPKKPIWYSPFLAVFLEQMILILKNKLNFKERIDLMFCLIYFTIGQFFLKLVLKFGKYAIPDKYKLRIGSYLYWNFMNGPNIEPIDSSLFQERIIRPRLGWFE